jgi:tetratricopeptide (TPR) repeat protein
VSLIADSLKKALKEKTFKGSPGINLLKNLGQKSKPRRSNSKEVKKFVLLIVVPASILVFLLVANPFAPKPKIVNKLPVVAEMPPARTAPAPKKREVVKPPPTPPVAPVVQKPVPQKIREKGPVMEPGMKEILLDELDIQVEPNQPTPKKPKPIARVDLKEPPDSPPAPIKFIRKPPAQKNKKLKAAKKQEQVSQPLVKNKTKKIAAKKIKKSVREQIAALPKKQNKITFPTTPEPKIFANSDYYFNRAIFYQQSKSWDKALSNYSKAAALSPDNADIYNNMGVIYKELKKYDRAIEEFLRAVYLNPNYAKPYNNIGVVYYAKEEFSSAIRNYQKAIKIDPQNLEALNNLAVVFKKLGQLEKAKAILNQALKLGASHAGTHYNMAVLYEELGNNKSAIHFYQEFAKFGSTSHTSLVQEVNEHIKTLK